MTTTQKAISATLILVWGIACWAFFQFAYQHHLFYQEQNQLFLLAADYIGGYLQQPAWLARMAGEAITQFYYYLYAAPIILTLALLTVGDLTHRALQRAGAQWGWAFAIAIAVMTLEALMALHITHRLSSVIALGGGLAAYLVASRLCRGAVSTAITLTLTALLTYWLFGYGVWVLQVLLVVEAGLKRSQQRSWTASLFLIPLVVALIVALTAPRLFCLTPAKALTYPGIGRPTLPERLIEKNLAVADDYYFGQHSRVKRLVEKDPHPTNEMLFFYNLVMAQQDSLPDALMRHTPNQLGTFYTIGPKSARFTIINMNELYWALGDMTLTERAAMMTNVFAPQNRNVRMIKRLAECNLVSGDTLAANKYLRLLSKTVAYRTWAKRMKDRQQPYYQYIADKRSFTNQADTIRIGDNLHRVMMQLLDSNPRNTTALDYILCSTLLLKDLDNFKRDYDRYCYGLEHERVKPLYQQALMIYLAGTEAPKEEWAKYIHDERQLQRFADYNAHRGDPRFRDTYWYYFDTAKPPQP